MLMDVPAALLSTGAMFVVGFVLLFLIYYFTTTIYTEYGDKKSRLYYSLLISLSFSLILAILFLVLPALSNSYGVLIGIAAGLVIIVVATIAQVFITTVLVRRGVIKMRQKKRKR